METGEVFLSEKDGITFIRVKGNASFACAPPLRELAKKLAAEPFSGLKIDLEECTWMDNLEHCENTEPLKEGEDHYELDSYHDFNGITSPYGAHFVLRVDKILMKEKYYNAIVNGVKRFDFPPCPVDYGYRDSKNFWYHKHGLMIPELLPMRQTTVQSVRYAADRIDPSITFTDDALARLVNVPRVFLPTVLKGCIKWAKENGVSTITEKEMDIINDKRNKEKKK